MKKKKLLFIWDFHGVLEKDNEYAVQRICRQVVKEFGFNTKVYLEDVRRWYGLKWIEYFFNLTEEQDRRKLRKMVKRAREVSQKIVHKYLKPMNHADYVLSQIKKSGGVNVIVSNARQDRIEDFVKIVGLQKYLYKVIGIDGHTRFKFSTPMEKANAISRLSAGKNYARKIIIGDSESDILAGKMVGAKTYLFVKKMNSKKVSDIKADKTIDDLRKILPEIHTA
ncbi:MAG: HAD family hydrolase [Candidatus Giovannonibacteria bacterium]|nr:MAG: HAD family hydrolase [Candidatus Giovannonibacteria bacterium]